MYNYDLKINCFYFCTLVIFEFISFAISKRKEKRKLCQKHNEILWKKPYFGYVAIWRFIWVLKDVNSCGNSGIVQKLANFNIFFIHINIYSIQLRNHERTIDEVYKITSYIHRAHRSLHEWIWIWMYTPHRIWVCLYIEIIHKNVLGKVMVKFLRFDHAILGGTFKFKIQPKSIHFRFNVSCSEQIVR